MGEMTPYLEVAGSEPDTFENVGRQRHAQLVQPPLHLLLQRSQKGLSLPLQLDGHVGRSRFGGRRRRIGRGSLRSSLRRAVADGRRGRAGGGADNPGRSGKEWRKDLVDEGSEFFCRAPNEPLRLPAVSHEPVRLQPGLEGGQRLLFGDLVEPGLGVETRTGNALH